jgi:hypothetical protein
MSNFNKLVSNIDLNVTMVTEGAYASNNNLDVNFFKDGIKLVRNTDGTYTTSYPLWFNFFTHSLKKICDDGIENKSGINLYWIIRASVYLNITNKVPFSSLERLRITESILEEL